MIALVDLSKRFPTTDAEGQTVAAALAHQLRYHLCPSWKVTAPPVVWYGTHPELVPPGAWRVYLMDDPDQQGALGWHDRDAQGEPFGRCFWSPSINAGVDFWSVVSHEVMEAAIDPGANRWADNGNGVLVALEVGDPVESDSYLIGAVRVSNFVTAAWFDPGAHGPFDHLGLLHAPFEVRTTGYTIRSVLGNVTSSFGEDYPQWRRALKGDGSRTARR